MTATLLAVPERLLTIPNVLTAALPVAVPVFPAAAGKGAFRFAFLLFVIASLTDILDGFVARWLNQRSRLGALLDPAADRTMRVCGYLFFTFPLALLLTLLSSAIYLRRAFFLLRLRSG